MTRSAIVMLCLALAGCGRPFDVKTAPGFVELDEEDGAYDYRAIAPDGVAIAVRSIEVDPDTSMAFWERAVKLRMRELDGYALVTAQNVRSEDGVQGRELWFGHDEQGKPFVYRVRLFREGSRLTVVEAGGAKEHMELWQSSVDHMLASIRVR